MQELTREQAIKRIKDIRNRKSVDHLMLTPEGNQTGIFSDHRRIGAVKELMAIFDITVEELK